MVFDANNVFADSDDRVYTSILYFSTAEEFQRELDLPGFTDIGPDYTHRPPWQPRAGH